MSSQQPNILFVMADQLIPFLTGAYGHPVVKTPNLDRLAREGVRFDAAYSPCPVCAPARAALMAGQYVSHIGAYDNGAALSCEEPTYAHYLSLAGYDTVSTGKLHFLGPDQLHGFRRRFTTNIMAADFALTPTRGVDDQTSKRHALSYVGEGIKVGHWNQNLSYDEETHFRALEYLHAKRIERRAARERGEPSQPFFLSVSYHHPHEPFWPPQELWDLYDGLEIEVPEFPENVEESWSTLDKWLNTYHGVAKAEQLRDPESMRRVRRAYYALVTYVDRKLGELLDALEENGFRKDTVVVFTSDHGDMLLEKGMVQKRTFYEWSARVPLIFHFPDGWQRGTVRPEPVNLIDLFPSFLDIAGVSQEDRLPVDGKSLIGLLDGSETGERVALSEYHSQGSHAPCFMVRQGKFKYVLIHGYESQLFDLEADPGEWNNLSGKPSHRGIEEQLRSRILSEFDPDAIDEAVQESVRKRTLVRRAMQVTGIHWDVEPRFDPTKRITDQYLPG
jgi:choline-sulfatase